MLHRHTADREVPSGSSGEPRIGHFLNGRRLAGAELGTPVGEGDQIDIVPRIGGGW
ncbi:MAG: hypothetical protein WD766_07605 [Gemmatimonadota bacterium]